MVMGSKAFTASNGYATITDEKNRRHTYPVGVIGEAFGRGYSINEQEAAYIALTARGLERNEPENPERLNKRPS